MTERDVRRSIRRRQPIRNIGALLSRSWPIVISTMLVVVTFRIDIIAVAVLLGSTDAGLYAAALRTAEATLFIAVALGTASYRELLATPVDLMHESSKKMFRVMFITGSTLGVCTGVVGYLGLPIVFGPEYKSASILVAILAVAVPAEFIRYAVSRLWIIEHAERASMLSSSLACILALSGYVLLTLRWGVDGTAWASVLAYWIAALTGYAVLPSVRRHGVRGPFLPSRVTNHVPQPTTAD